MKKDTEWPIEEDIDGVIVFKCACILKWVAPKNRCICALVCRATQVEVRVLFESDTRTVLVTVEVPKNLWKQRTGTEFL